MTLYFFSAVTIMLFVVSMLNYNISSDIIVNSAEMNTVDSIKKSAEYITDYTEKLKTTANVISTNNTIKDYIYSKSEAGKDKVLSLIKTIIDTDPNLVSAVLITRDGRIVSNENSIEMRTSSDMMKENWYKQAVMQNAMPILTSARKAEFSKNEDNWVISVTQEVVDEKKNNLGVVRLDIDYHAIENYLKRLNLGKSGYAFITDESGQAVYHPNKEVFTSDENRREMIKIANSKDGYYKKNSQFVKHHYMKNLNWKITCVTSLDELKLINRSLLHSFILIVILSAIFASIGTFFAIKRLIRPIKDLQNTMDRIEKGEKNIRAKEDGSIELQDLERHFNMMLDKMEKLMVEIKDREQDIREYELKTLSSQINPHFLYNTLDTIIWMAEFNDSESVVELTKSLAKFFRLSLNYGNEIISLHDEIDHVRQYLFIQKKRYGSKLNYNISENIDCSDFMLPKLVLQPIVENAIYHGIKSIPEGGTVDISVDILGEHICVRIYDNGVGLPTKMTKKEFFSRLGGVGIINVDKRLHLHFGDSYRMEIESEPGEFTSITMYFPISK